MTSALFAPLALRELEISNRIVVSPMCQYSSNDGSANDWHIVNLGHLSLCGPGIAFCEATAVSPEGRITSRDLGLYSDENQTSLARVAQFIHEWTPAKFGVQLAHAGRKASTMPPWEGGGPAPPEFAYETVAPSAVAFKDDWQVPRELDRAGLQKVRDDFVRAAQRCEEIGADIIELHFAHGYLGHQFLSPLSNDRSDEYGGSRENRMRFPLEIYRAVRKVWPAEKPLGARLSATDHAEGGWSLEDAIAFATALKDDGCDFVDVSSGGLVAHQHIDVHTAYQVPYSAAIKRDAEIHTIAVGKIDTPEVADAVVANGEADMVALARGFLRHPRFVWDAADRFGEHSFTPNQYKRAHSGASR